MASYSKDNRGKWHVRFRISSKQIHLSGFDTKREAENAYIIHPKDKQIAEKDFPTFKELFTQFIDYKKSNIKDSTIHSYKIHYKLYLTKFHNFKINKINEINIIEWQHEINKSKLGFNTKSNIWSSLTGILSFATTIYKIPNPIKAVKGFRNNEPRKEMQFWANEEFNIFINGFNENDIIYKTFFTCLFYLGLRKGEALALTWHDIDFTKATCRINKTYSRKTTDGNKYKITAPKTTNSNRTILIPDTALKHFANLYEHYENMIGKEIKKEWFVFGLENPICETQFDKKRDTIIKKTNVKKIRIHDLRHSHASDLLRRGASIMFVAKRLGNTEKQILETYAHQMPTEEYDIIKKL